MKVYLQDHFVWPGIKKYAWQALLLLLMISTDAAFAREMRPEGAADPVIVTGTVTDQDGETLVGVTVKIKGTTTGTTTGQDGKFTITVPSPTSILVFSYLGFAMQEVSVDNLTSLAISMLVEATSMKEVIVVGYGETKKNNITGAVTQIGSEYFDDRPMPNVARGLQGVIPNLNIKMTDGKPIRTATYNIRGTTSIGGGGSALVLVDGVPGDPSTLNPSDIESVTVLKDAASAAIYGARGAFGVLLITTKTAKKNKIQLNYTTNYSINQKTTNLDLVNDSYTWAKLYDESFYAWNDYLNPPTNIGSILTFSPAYLEELKKRSEDPSLPKTEIDPITGQYVYYANTDWHKELYKNNNSTMEHALSISGGGEKVNFLMSGRYYFQDGIFRYNTDKFNRYNLRLKGNVKVNDWLNVNTNTDLSNYTYRYPLTSRSGLAAVWRTMSSTAYPVAPLLNPDGTITTVGAYSIGDLYYGKSFSDDKQFFLKNTLGFSASIIKNKLNIKGDATHQWTNTDKRQKFFQVPYSVKPGEVISTGLNYLGNNVGNLTYQAANIYTDFTQNWGRHQFKIMSGWNVEYNSLRSQYAERDGLLLDNFVDFSSAVGTNIELTGSGSEYAYSGLFYRANYSFDNRYLLELNGRYDGSSKFPETQRYGFFPSGSAGWRVSEEKFMAGTKKWLDEFKLRASYGTLGNGNIAPYTYLETMGVSTSSVIVNGRYQNYIQKPAVVPEGLTWERSTTLDFGADLEMFNNRLIISADWYQRKVTGMITGGPTLPASFGAPTPRGNNAELVTTGWEGSLAWNGLIKTRKPISYGLRLTLADNVAKVTKFYNPNQLISTYNEGRGIGDIWGYETLGFFTSAADIASSPNQSYFVVSNTNKLLPGDIKFADLNNDGKVNPGKSTLLDPGDRKIIGNSSIRYPYGITGDFGWNNFTLTAFFQGVGKRDWYPGVQTDYFWGQYSRPYSFLPEFTLNRWTEDNPSQDAYFPRYRGFVALSGTRELAVPQTRYLQNASYIRLKNLTVGYSLPAKFLQRAKISSVRFILTGQNLWTYSPMYKVTKNFDPEVIEGSDPEINSGSGDGFSYPMLKTYTFGINVGL